jgi:hypothetical protein
MNTAISTKRKLIDIPSGALHTLSIKASIEGTNVKKYIERLLLLEADKIESQTDYKIYKSLLESDPDGKQYLTKEEAFNFEKRIGL